MTATQLGPGKDTFPFGLGSPLEAPGTLRASIAIFAGHAIVGAQQDADAAAAAEARTGAACTRRRSYGALFGVGSGLVRTSPSSLHPVSEILVV